MLRCAASHGRAAATASATAPGHAAPWTGALADFLGRRRVLIGAGLGLAALSLAYVWVTDWRALVALAAVHGVLWSSQLTAAAEKRKTP